MTDNYSQVPKILYKAIKNSDWYVIDKFVENGGDINSILVDSGPTVGYTALHLACRNIYIDPYVDRSFEVSTFIERYKPNVNAVGEDGIQPIHLACVFENIDAVDVLLKSGANVDAEISKEFHEKYAKSRKWTNGLDSKITLLTWAIINRNHKLEEHLLRRGSNFAIKDINNQTLLMYAVGQGNIFSLDRIIPYLHKHPNLINARDNNGLHVVHYIVRNEKFRKYQYRNSIFVDNSHKIIAKLIEAGADMNATVNGDPNTLLLNKAAYEHCWALLDELLKFKVPLSEKSKPLHYLMLSYEDLTKRLNLTSLCLSYNSTSTVELTYRRCMERILENFVIRRSCGRFVPEEEIKLMDQLVVTDPKIRKFVNDCEENSINKLLKAQKVHYDGKFICLHEIVKKTGDNRSLKLLVKDDSFIKAFNKSAGRWHYKNKEINNVLREVNVLIQESSRRRKLLKKFEKIENLTKAVPLPYEIILEIIDFIDNTSLRNFIDAFNDANDTDDSD